jgi:DNA repair ATPase RecN
MNADNQFNLPPVDAIAKEESLEFTEVIDSDEEQAENADFWGSNVDCQSTEGTFDDFVETDPNLEPEVDWDATVQRLERALAKSEQKLELQIERSRSANHLIDRQATELNEAQKQIARLFCQLEAMTHNDQRQQEQLEFCTEQLQSARERIALIERECSSLQTKYQQQTDRLLEREGRVRELSYRLDRQQRYTLQFKAALDRCLAEPDPNLLHNPPIPPWSEQIYQSLQAEKMAQSSRLHQKASRFLSIDLPMREPRSMSEVDLPRFYQSS